MADDLVIFRQANSASVMSALSCKYDGHVQHSRKEAGRLCTGLSLLFA